MAASFRVFFSFFFFVPRAQEDETRTRSALQGRGGEARKKKERRSVYLPIIHAGQSRSRARPAGRSWRILINQNRHAIPARAFGRALLLPPSYPTYFLRLRFLSFFLSARCNIAPRRLDTLYFPRLFAYLAGGESGWWRDGKIVVACAREKGRNGRKKVGRVRARERGFLF